MKKKLNFALLVLLAAAMSFVAGYAGIDDDEISDTGNSIDSSGSSWYGPIYGFVENIANLIIPVVGFLAGEKTWIFGLIAFAIFSIFGAIVGDGKWARFAFFVTPFLIFRTIVKISASGEGNVIKIVNLTTAMVIVLGLVYLVRIFFEHGEKGARTKLVTESFIKRIGRWQLLFILIFITGAIFNAKFCFDANAESSVPAEPDGWFQKAISYIAGPIQQITQSKEAASCAVKDMWFVVVPSLWFAYFLVYMIPSIFLQSKRKESKEALEKTKGLLEKLPFYNRIAHIVGFVNLFGHIKKKKDEKEKRIKEVKESIEILKNLEKSYMSQAKTAKVLATGLYAAELKDWKKKKDVEYDILRKKTRAALFEYYSLEKSEAEIGKAVLDAEKAIMILAKHRIKPFGGL